MFPKCSVFPKLLEPRRAECCLLLSLVKFHRLERSTWGKERHKVRAGEGKDGSWLRTLAPVPFKADTVAWEPVQSFPDWKFCCGPHTANSDCLVIFLLRLLLKTVMSHLEVALQVTGEEVLSCPCIFWDTPTWCSVECADGFTRHFNGFQRMTPFRRAVWLLGVSTALASTEALASDRRVNLSH